MADQDRNDDVRKPEPEAAAQDAENASRQEQVRRDTEANRAQAARVEETTPDEIRNRTVGEIVEGVRRSSENREP